MPCLQLKLQYQQLMSYSMQRNEALYSNPKSPSLFQIDSLAQQEQPHALCVPISPRKRSEPTAPLPLRSPCHHPPPSSIMPSKASSIPSPSMLKPAPGPRLVSSAPSAPTAPTPTSRPSPLPASTADSHFSSVAVPPVLSAPHHKTASSPSAPQLPHRPSVRSESSASHAQSSAVPPTSNPTPNDAPSLTSSFALSSSPLPSRPHRLRVIMFSCMPYERVAFEEALKKSPTANRFLDIVYVTACLDYSTASLAADAQAVCLFATDEVEPILLSKLHALGVRLVALRYAGISSIDMDVAHRLGIAVARTPAHAATSIAEYTVTLMLALNRKVHVACSRVRDGNFSLQGLVGFDMAGKTVGIIGMGLVGQLVARILRGFGCRILAYDVGPHAEVNASIKFVQMHELLATSDIISLHAPLVPGTIHMLGRETLPMCKRGVFIVNTSRGALIDVHAMINNLTSGQVAGLAMDVYEGETSMFFKESGSSKHDLDFHVLRAMPNVIITGRQSSLTTNALASVAIATVRTLEQFYHGEELEYVVRPDDQEKNSGSSG